MNAAQRPEPRPLPRDLEGSNLAGESRVVVFDLSDDESRTLLDRAPPALAASADEILVAALAAALRDWTGGEAAVVSIERHGRDALDEELDLSRTVGCFSTFVPSSFSIRAGAPIGEALEAVKVRFGSPPDGAVDKAEVSFSRAGELDAALAGPALLRRAPESCGPLEAPGRRRQHLIDVATRRIDGRVSLEFTYCASIHRRETIEALAQAVARNLRDLLARTAAASAAASAQIPSSTRLAALHPTGQRPPVILFPGIGGSVDSVRALGDRLRGDRSVYALQGLSSDDVGEMAERSIEAIRGVVGDRPYQLCGWSMGGFVAYEVARRLVQRAEPVASLVIVDLPLHNRVRYDRGEMEALQLFAMHAGLPPHSLGFLSLLNREERSAWVARRLGATRAYVGGMTALYQAHGRAIDGYQPPPGYAGPMLLVFSEETADQPGVDPTSGWSSLGASRIGVKVVAGNHRSVMREPYVGALAEAIQGALV